MLNRLLKIIGVLLSLIHVSAAAQDFSYTYGGTTIKYSIKDGNAVTKAGTTTGKPGNTDIKGDVVIPETVVYNKKEYTVTEISGFSFSNNNGITSVTLPSTVTTISSNGFYGCSMMESINTVNVTSLGAYAFRGCEKLQSVDLNPGITILNPNTFYGCKALTSITMPDALTEIGSWTFANCTSLAEVSWGNSKVSKMGSSCFTNCSALKKFVFPEDMTVIPGACLSGCSKLTEITLPPNVTKIEQTALQGCAFSSIDIPESVTLIGTSCFTNNIRLQSITFPPKVTILSERVLRGCTGLKEVKFMGEITTIGPAAFYECKSLPEIELQPTVTSIGEYCFYRCESLTSITIPEGISNIGQYFFYKCQKLIEINLPGSLTEIGNDAFSGCQNLPGLILPDQVAKIGDSAFYGCNTLTELILPASVTYVGNEAFRSMVHFKSLVSLATVPPTADADAFFGVYDQATLSVPAESLELYKNTAPWSTFFNIKAYLPDPKVGDEIKVGDVTYVITDLEDMTVSTRPATETGTGNLCSGDLALPSTVVYGDYEFTLESIGSHGFTDNMELLSVTIPSSVKQIGENAFAGCEALKVIEIPKSVTSIGEKAFDNCNNLETLIYMAENPVIANPDIFSTYTTTTLYAPATAKEQYLANEPWKDFANIVWCGVSIDEKVINIMGENAVKVAALITAVPGETYTLTWKSDNPEVASASEDGSVTGVATGDATITVTATGDKGNVFTASVPVHVQMSTGIPAVGADDMRIGKIYNMQGILVRENAYVADFGNLAPGIYIAGGKKFIVR